MTVSSNIQLYQLNPLRKTYRSSIVPKTQFSNNPVYLNIVSLLMIEWVKVLPTSCLRESLVLDQPAKNESSSFDKSTPSETQPGSVKSTILRLKRGSKINPTLRHCLNYWAQKNSCINEWCFNFRYTQTWLRTGSNELARSCEILRGIFAYVDVQVVVYTLEENGVHGMSTEADAEFYADNEIER